MYQDLDQEAVPWDDDNQSVTNTEGDMSSVGEMISQPILVPASNMSQTSIENDTLLPLIPPASPDTIIGNSQSPAPTRPRQNVGTYKQGENKFAVRWITFFCLSTRIESTWKNNESWGWHSQSLLNSNKKT